MIDSTLFLRFDSFMSGMYLFNYNKVTYPCSCRVYHGVR